MRQRRFAKQVPPLVEKGWICAPAKPVLQRVTYYANTVQADTLLKIIAAKAKECCA
jgi:hypothetical protein